MPNYLFLIFVIQLFNQLNLDSAQPIPTDLVQKLVGNGVACSPIVTVEPRRRKFHKAITLQLPLPVAGNKGMINEYKQDAPTLRLLFSLTGGSNKAVWEDLSGSTPLSLINNCVSFTTTVSARFWLIDCRQIAESPKFASIIYSKAIEVPFLVKFITYVKQVSLSEYELRMFILTDDKEEKTLEQLENYVEIAKSKSVEINQYSVCYLEFAGNFKPIVNSSEQLQLRFEAFRENRLACRIKIKNLDAELVGRVAFMREKRRKITDLPQTPICNLNIILPYDPSLPEEPPKLSPRRESPSSFKLNGYKTESSPLSFKQSTHSSPRKQQFNKNQDIELHPTLVKVSNQLEKDWTQLSAHLSVPDDLVDQLANEPDLTNQQRAAYLLQYWQNNLNADPRNPSENVLENSLRRIGREDIIYKAIFNIDQVDEQIKKTEQQKQLYADINKQDYKSNVHTYEPFEQQIVDEIMDQEEPEIVQLDEPVPIRYENNEVRYEHSPELVELTDGFTIEQQQRQPSASDLLEPEPYYEEFSTSQPQHEESHHRIESELLLDDGRRQSESANDFILEETVPDQSSQQQQQPKSRQELPDSITETHENIEITDESVIHTVTQSTKTTITETEEEPSSSSLIDFRPEQSGQRFEPQQFNVEPQLISSNYYQKREDENDFKMHVEQKEDENKITFTELWFESNTIKDQDKLSVQFNGKQKAISDRNINLNDNDEKFVFSLELIEKLRAEFTGEKNDEITEWIEEQDGTTKHIIEQKTVCSTIDTNEKIEEDKLVSYEQKKDYFQKLSEQSKILPVPRSWSTDEQILQTDDQQNKNIKLNQRSLSTSATSNELKNVEQLVQQKQSIPEYSEHLDQTDRQTATLTNLLNKEIEEERRSSVIEEIPQFKERVEYFRRKSKEESIDDNSISIQSSNSSNQFTPNTAKKVAEKIVTEVSKRAIEQISSSNLVDQENEVINNYKMSKTSESNADISQEEDVDLSVSSHWYSGDSLSSSKNKILPSHSKLIKQEKVLEQEIKYDQNKLDELSHKIKRARYDTEEDVPTSTATEITGDQETSNKEPKSIQNLFRSQSLEGSTKQKEAETNRKLSLKDSTSSSNLDQQTPPTTPQQSRQWFKPPLPTQLSKNKILSSKKNESIEEIKENLEKTRQYRSASLGKEGIFQFTQKSLSSSLQALVSGKLTENSFNTLERALNIIRAYDLQQLEPDNSIYELLDAIDDQDFKKALPLANAFLDDEYKKLLSSVDLLDDENSDSKNEIQQQDTLEVPGDNSDKIKKQSSFEKQQLELQKLEESLDIDELIDLIPDEQTILSKKFRESDLVLLRKLRSIEDDDAISEQTDQNNNINLVTKEPSLSLSNEIDVNNNLTSFELSDYPESLRLSTGSKSQLSRSPNELQDLEQTANMQFKQNASIQTEKSFLLTQRMHTINAIVQEISRPEFVDEALCSSPTGSSTYSSETTSQSQTCDCSECQNINELNQRKNSVPNNDNLSLQSYETCPSLITSCSDDFCKRKQSLQSEMYFTCSEGSISSCSTCSSLNSLENKIITGINKKQNTSANSPDERPTSVCESSSTITSRSTLDSVAEATAAVESGLIALIAGELTLLLGELTLKFEMSKRLGKDLYESTTTSESEATKQSINEEYEQLIREHLAPIYEIYGKELPENCIAELIGKNEDGNLIITEQDIQPEQLALRTQEMLRNALPIKTKKLSSSKDNILKKELRPDLMSPEESEGVWVQTFPASTSSTSKKEIETQTSEEDFEESDNSDSLFGKYLMMDNDKLLKQRPLLLDVDDFVNYLVDYCNSATGPENNSANVSSPSRPNLSVKDVMINLRKSPKFINFLNRINGQLKANANNEIITNHDLLLEMVTDQCKDELINILKDVIQGNLEYDEFNPTLDSIPEEDSDELQSKSSTLNAKKVDLYNEQQKAVEKWLAASLDNLATYVQQKNIPNEQDKNSDSQIASSPTIGANNLDKSAENKNNDEVNGNIDNGENLISSLASEQKEEITEPDKKEKENVNILTTTIKMPVFSQESIIIAENLNDEKIENSEPKGFEDNKKFESKEDNKKLDNNKSKDEKLNQQLNEIPIKLDKKETNTLQVPNTFTRLALSLDEGSDDDEINGNKKKLEKTHSLPEEEFFKKALDDFADIKNKKNPHLTNLDLSQIEAQPLTQEEVLSSLLQNQQKRPKLKYQFASEDDLFEAQESDHPNLDEDNLEYVFDDENPQDSIFDNLNLMETIEESFEDDNSIIQNQENIILSQQQQIAEQQMELNRNEQTAQLELQKQQEMFANELMELQKEYANLYSEQQDQYFNDMQKINLQNLEIQLEQLIDQSNYGEEEQNQNKFDEIQDLIEKLSKQDENINAEINDNFGKLQNQPKLKEKSLSDSLEKSTSSDASVVTEILNESFPSTSTPDLRKDSNKLFNSSIQSENLLTHGNVDSQDVLNNDLDLFATDDHDVTASDQKLILRNENESIENKISSIDIKKLTFSKENIDEDSISIEKQSLLTESDKPNEDLLDKNKKDLKKIKEINPSSYDMRDVAKAAFEMQIDDTLDEKKKLDKDLDLESINLQDEEIDETDLNLEMIENISLKLENLVTQAKFTNEKEKNVDQTKFIKSSLMEEIAQTLNDLLVEAKQVLGDNQITLSSQKLNTKNEVIKNIADTLENLLTIDQEPIETDSQKNKSIRKNLIHNITKSLESLLTDPQKSNNVFSLFKRKQRSFDQEPKLNMIITRSLENLLELSNPEFTSSQLSKKSKKPSVIENITRTLENLFTKSQVEIETIEDEPDYSQSTEITLNNQRFEYTNLPFKYILNKIPSIGDSVSPFKLIDNDQISIKSTDSQSSERPKVPKRTKKLKISNENQEKISLPDEKETSLITVMSPDIIEEKKVILPEVNAEISKIEIIDNEFNQFTTEPVITSQSSNLNFANDKSIEIELVDDEIKELEPVNNLIQRVSKDSDLIISEFDQKQIGVNNVSVVKNLETFKTDYSHVPVIPKDDDKISNFTISKTNDLIKTEYNKVPVISSIDKSVEKNIMVEKNSDMIKTDYHKVPIQSITKIGDHLKTEFYHVQQEKQEKEIELEKIEEEKDEKKQNKKLKLKMPIKRNESILVRQTQIDEQEDQIVSNTFDIKLLSDEDITPEILNYKTKPQERQTIELNDELNLNDDNKVRKQSIQSDQSDYKDAGENIIDQYDDDKFRELANTQRKKSVRFQSPDVVKDIRLITPNLSVDNEFYDADDVNFNQQAIQDLIDNQLSYLKEINENNFDKDSLNTLIEQQSDTKDLNEKRKRELSDELEYPPELIELMSRSYDQLSEKEKSKLKKLKDKYDEKLRKLKDKQQAKLKKEEEKARKKAEEEEKKAEKARKKEEEKTKKQEEKKLKKLKEDEDKKIKKLDESNVIKDDKKALEQKSIEKLQEISITMQAEKQEYVKNILAEKIDNLKKEECQDNILKDNDLQEMQNKNLLNNSFKEEIGEKKEDNILKDNDDNLKLYSNLEPEIKPRKKRLSRKSSPKINDKLNNENEEIEVSTNIQNEDFNKQNESELESKLDNLLETQSIKGLSPDAKLNNKLFKKSSIDDSSKKEKDSIKFEDNKYVKTDEKYTIKDNNLPIIVTTKSSTLDERLLRKKSTKLKSIDHLDFHHLDNVGCLDSSIKNYFNNFEILERQKRSLSPTTLTLTRAQPYNTDLAIPSSNIKSKRHTISAKKSPPYYLENLRAQLNLLSNAELSFFAKEIKENKIKPPSSNQFEIINKSLLSALHHSELSVSTPCLSEIVHHQSRQINYIPPYIPRIPYIKPSSTNIVPVKYHHPTYHHLQMPSIDLNFKTESMPTLISGSNRLSTIRPFSKYSINSYTTPFYNKKYDFLYKDTGDVYYRDTIFQLKRIEEQLNRLKNRFDSTANLSITNTKSYLNRVGSRKLPESGYKYHCQINLVKEEIDVKPKLSEDDKNQSRTKLYFRIYDQIGCNHIGSRDFISKIKEHEDEFRVFSPPYVCVLCYYTVIAIHYLMKQGYELHEAINIVRKKQDQEKEDRWKHRPTTLLDTKYNYLSNYSNSRPASPLSRSTSTHTSNVCHQATTHLNHHQHYSYERSHDRFYHRDEYLNFKSSNNLDNLNCSNNYTRSKSPNLENNTLSTVNKTSCNSLYHSSYRTNYSNSKWTSDYMKRKSRIDPFLKDTNFRKAELMWKSKYQH